MSYKTDTKYIHAMQPGTENHFFDDMSICRPNKPLSLQAIASTDYEDVTCVRCLIKLRDKDA